MSAKVQRVIQLRARISSRAVFRGNTRVYLAA
jgi:hypothetical protein